MSVYCWISAFTLLATGWYWTYGIPLFTSYPMVLLGTFWILTIHRDPDVDISKSERLCLRLYKVGLVVSILALLFFLFF